MENKQKNFALLTLAIAAIIISIFLFTKQNSTFEQEDLLEVKTEKVKKRILHNKKEFVGVIRSKKSVTLQFDIVGKIIFLAEDGKTIKKGEVIAKLDSQEAEGKYEMAEAILKNHTRELANIKTLLKEGYATQEHYEKQKAKCEESEGKLKECKAFLEKHTIIAPFDGSLGLHQQSLGSTVTQNSKIITLSDLQSLEVDFNISETTLNEIGNIEELQNSSISLIVEGSILPIETKFSAQESVFDPDMNTIKIRLNINTKDSQKKLLPGQTCIIVAKFSKKKNILTVSKSSIKKTLGSTYVYKIEEDIYGKKTKNVVIESLVETGIEDLNYIEIVNGLKENDEIVLEEHYKIRDGQLVKKQEN